ncbi:MAG: farnesyl diphosphate synthase [Pseudomonadota bacterium]|nr:farnesyl diphosphate synthase [Pseudoalteromonas spongiae]MEC8324816.1 farnesyl diphosphate synthase [Pseudomonadota bacterium]
MNSVDSIISAYLPRIEENLSALTPASHHTDEKLVAACRYSLLNGGKRLRPILVYLTGELFNADNADLDRIACAIECIHSYSLVHDDLPAMDDDELRRGRPTCHIAYDEATAILVGDALQCLAFETITESQFNGTTVNNQLKIVNTLANASGLLGMCGGQALDIAATDSVITLTQLEQVHKLKTGALLKSAIKMGALAGNANELEIAALARYAEAIGLAFQVQDDILDVEGDTHTLGKPQGSDIEANKATYPALLGIEGAKDKARNLVNQAINALSEIDADTGRLKAIAEYIIARDH